MLVGLGIVPFAHPMARQVTLPGTVVVDELMLDVGGETMGGMVGGRIVPVVVGSVVPEPVEVGIDEDDPEPEEGVGHPMAGTATA